MNGQSPRRLTGILFIAGSILICIPYSVLAIRFEYPDILRFPPEEILVRYHDGGSPLVLTWLAFAWSGLPILFAMVLLQNVMKRESIPYLRSGTILGIIGGIVQMVGLLRWVFVVPTLAETFTDPSVSAPAKEASIVVFQATHQFGGVLLGEHLGQAFTIIWMVLVSLGMFKSSLFRPWLACWGVLASIIYLLAQAELLSTVVEGIPVVPEAGLVGSLLWLTWMTALGVTLLGRAQRPPERTPSSSTE